MQKIYLNKAYYYLTAVVLTLLMLSLPTSKAGMNIFSALLALGGFGYAIFNVKTLTKLEKFAFLFCIATYSIGGIASYALHASELDFAYYMQKNSFWLLIPVFILILKHEQLKNLACIAFILAATIAGIESLYDAYLANFDVYARSTGFLGHSRHANSMLLSIGLSLIYLNKKETGTAIKSLLWGCIIIAILSLLVSGSRGAWLGGGAMLLYVIIRFHKALIKPGIILAILVAVIASISFPDKVERYVERAKSIVHLELSGLARLTMWRGGLEYMGHQVSDSPITLIAGSGMYSAKEKYLSYVDALQPEEREHLLTDGGVFGGSDFHNSILDVFVKSGVLYATLFFGAWAFVISKAMKGTNQDIFACRYVIAYFVGLFVIYQFYTIAQDYATYATAFAVSLLLSEMMREKEA
ncbi:hypothetical protein CW749_07715 [Vibrio sp. vnigr-6D03]|uniref:O-antigen ligase family protein n=1 Tax=Vibrio sp. vnigr-6D03 TaxID=2058088 RepID=UPI000C341999|nr:O-antigen ligase family protein [Vibrio sp. vnigr-6D03]PKF80193.1 hypothetical protein CW749_07715 [Vibrio sp. vnigr-6D03]